MGSVGEDYRCCYCGRIGNGGYHVDNVGMFCTGPEINCLDKFLKHGLDGDGIRAKALALVLVNRLIDIEILKRIVSYM